MAFVKGKSGNPKGRPRGTVNSFSKYRKQVDAATPEIITTLIELAKEGNISAAKILLDRVFPVEFLEYERLKRMLERLEAANGQAQ